MTDGPRARLSRFFERRTLRFRVLATLVGLVAIACVILGAATGLALHAFLIHQLDQRLAAAGSRYIAAYGDRDSDGVGTSDGDGGFGDSRGQAVGTFGAHLRHGVVTTAGIVGAARPPVLTAAARRVLATLPLGQPASRDLAGLGDYRLLAIRDRNGVVSVTGLPLQPVDDTLERLILVEGTAFAVLLAAAAAGGWWLVGLSLRPLHRVTATARDVSVSALDGESPLHQRVPAVGGATEVGQLGEAFNRMLDHVDASLAARRRTEERLRQFLADASHELRTPVASIRAHAESTRRAEADLPAPVAAALHRIEAEAVRMGVLVDDLLLLARLDAGRPLGREPVDMTRIVIDTTNDARVAFPGHRWRLGLPDHEVVVTGDEYRLHQVLANLLTNAGRHTPPGTLVTTELEVSAGEAVLRVVDDGPGIPEDRQPMLFERFFRGDTRASGPGSGSGLGLAIVAAVIKAHQGSVGVDSQPGRTAFEVRLPLPPTAPGVAPSTAEVDVFPLKSPS